MCDTPPIIEEYPWHTAKHPGEMISTISILNYLSTKKISRKMRLFACNFTRTLSHTLHYQCIDAIDMIEDLVDSNTDPASREYNKRFNRAKITWSKGWRRTSHGLNMLPNAIGDGSENLLWSLNPCHDNASIAANMTWWHNEYYHPIQHRIIKDMFRDPRLSLPNKNKVDWRKVDNQQVITLSRAIYQDRDYTALPILADALEDSGCDDQVMLAHCRDSKEHYRGCWVLDEILDL